MLAWTPPVPPTPPGPRATADWSGELPKIFSGATRFKIPDCPVWLDVGEGYYAVAVGVRHGVFLCW